MKSETQSNDAAVVLPAGSQNKFGAEYFFFFFFEEPCLHMGVCAQSFLKRMRIHACTWATDSSGENDEEHEEPYLHMG